MIVSYILSISRGQIYHYLFVIRRHFKKALVAIYVIFICCFCIFSAKHLTKSAHVTVRNAWISFFYICSALFQSGISYLRCTCHNNNLLSVSAGLGDIFPYTPCLSLEFPFYRQCNPGICPRDFHPQASMKNNSHSHLRSQESSSLSVPVLL